jgi:SAM-dependent methyltransferase/methyltransferase-like protein
MALSGNRRLSDGTGNEDLARKYDSVPYAAQSHAVTHPDRIATVATLLGLQPPAVATCRVLEIGCSDGANLLPMAASLPQAQFVGCDLSPRAIATARITASELGLSNVTLLQEDLASLPDAIGRFDYVIAHGVYSWVPAPARDALLALGARSLTPDGIAFVSHNVLPGCYVRRLAADILHYHTDAMPDLGRRFDAARALSRILAQPGPTQQRSDAALRAEFARLAERPDSALFHDDLAVPNDAFYFHEFAAHAARHGLKFVADATLITMTTTGFAPALAEMVDGMDRLAREQYLDFARFRRFRQSLLCRAESQTGFSLSPDRISLMHVSAASVLREMIEGKDDARRAAAGDQQRERPSHALLKWLLEVSPRAVSVDEAKAWLHERNSRDPGVAAPRRRIEAILAEAFVAGAVQLHVHPPMAAAAISERPIASAVARWQARRQTKVTNLRHETMTLPDATARQIIALLDGSRNIAAVVEALGPAFEQGDKAVAMRRVEEYLADFVKLSLLAG